MKRGGREGQTGKFLLNDKRTTGKRENSRREVKTQESERKLSLESERKGKKIGGKKVGTTE